MLIGYCRPEKLASELEKERERKKTSDRVAFDQRKERLGLALQFPIYTLRVIRYHCQKEIVLEEFWLIKPIPERRQIWCFWKTT